MDSLVETSMSVDVVQNVVVEQYAKIPSVLINVLADKDSKVSSKTLIPRELDWGIGLNTFLH